MANKTDVYSNWKGMNRQADITNMSAEYWFDIYNGYTGKDTSVEKRFGYDKKFSVQITEGSPAAAVDILVEYDATYDDSSEDKFVCTADHIYRWNAAGPAWVDLKTNAGSCTFVSTTQYGDIIVFSDGINTPQKFTKGGVATADLTMPAGVTSFKYVYVHNNRLWGITDDYLAYYSALGDIEDFTTTGAAGSGYLNLLAYISVGDEIKQIATFSKAYLSFFLTKSIITYSIGTDATEFAILQTTVNTGTKSSQGALSFGDDLFYLDDDTPKSLKASLTSQDLDINDFTKGIFGNYYRDIMYAVSNDRICVTKYTKRSWIIIHIPIGNGGEILIWDYAYQLWVGRWRVYDKINSIYEDSDGNLSFTSTGYVYNFDTTLKTDDGETIEFYAKSPFLYGKNTFNYERIPYIEAALYSESSSVEVQVSVYFEYESSPSTYEVVSLSSPTSLWDVALWDVGLWDSSGQDIYRIHCTGRGKMHRLMFRNNQSDKDVKINLYKIYRKNLGKN